MSQLKTTSPRDFLPGLYRLRLTNEQKVDEPKSKRTGILRLFLLLGKNFSELAHHPSVLPDQRGGSGRALRMRRAI